MGYDRNDRSYYGQDRGGSGQDRGQDRGGFGADRGRPYGGQDQYGRQSAYGRDDDRARDHGDYGRDNRGDQDRGFFERAGDEVRSWFGDDDAEQRRRNDERYDERSNRGDYGSNRSYGSGRDSGYGSGGSRDTGAGRSYGGGQGQYGRGGSAYGSGNAGSGSGFGGGADRSQNRDTSHPDHGYSSWRDRQMAQFDREYDDYRREHQGKFDSEFGNWRQQRQGQRDLIGKVQEHQEVVGSDGQHIGTVDHVRGDRILLTKSDQAAGGEHHSIPASWVQSVDDKVTVSKSADQAKQHWRDEKRNEGGMFGGNDDRSTNLNRSFSGTY